MIFDIAVAAASGQQRRDAARLDGGQSFQFKRPGRQRLRRNKPRMQTESQEETVGIIPPSHRHPPLIGSHYSVSALVLVVGAIPSPSIIAMMVVTMAAVLVVV
jgi:hypothetical protein